MCDETARRRVLDCRSALHHVILILAPIRNRAWHVFPQTLEHQNSHGPQPVRAQDGEGMAALTGRPLQHLTNAYPSLTICALKCKADPKIIKESSPQSQKQILLAGSKPLINLMSYSIRKNSAKGPSKKLTKHIGRAYINQTYPGSYHTNDHRITYEKHMCINKLLALPVDRIVLVCKRLGFIVFDTRSPSKLAQTNINQSCEIIHSTCGQSSWRARKT